MYAHRVFDIMYHASTYFYIFAMVVQEVHGLTNWDNYILCFLAEISDIECSNSMFKFKTICKRLGLPIAAEKNGRSCEKYGILWID